MVKIRIPMAKKIEVWRKYYGMQAKFVCYCCKGNPISLKDYSCGHVLAEANGGSLRAENLRPLCQGCNSSMGTTHMFLFMAKYDMSPPVVDPHFDAYLAAYRGGKERDLVRIDSRFGVVDSRAGRPSIWAQCWRKLVAYVRSARPLIGPEFYLGQIFRSVNAAIKFRTTLQILERKRAEW